jgi:uncharacterized membrane protein YoaK (UPF0700 family)
MPSRPLLPVEHQFIAGLLILTASTGCVDAVSYLALDKVFTGNMTGNVLFIGFSLVHAGTAPLLNNVIALLGFALGSIVGGRIVGRNAEKGLPWTSRGILIGGAALMILLAVFWVVVHVLVFPALLTVTALLAMIMGAQVSAVKPVGNSDVTTIVVTNTLANLARDSRLAGGTGKNWFPRLAAIICMGIGAAIGASLVTYLSGPSGLVGAAVIFSAGTITLVSAHRRLHSAR